jgi:hypothetical protein
MLKLLAGDALPGCGIFQDPRKAERGTAGASIVTDGVVDLKRFLGIACGTTQIRYQRRLVFIDPNKEAFECHECFCNIPFENDLVQYL